MATIIGDKIKLTNYTYYLEDNIKKEKGDGTREENEKVLDAFDIDWHSFNVIDNIRNKTYPIGSTEDLLSYVSMAYSNTNINLMGIEQNNIKPSKSLSNIYFDKQTNIFSYTYFNNVGYFSSFSNKGEIFNDYIYNKALGINSHAEGSHNIINENAHSGHAEGNGNIVNGEYSHAEGNSNTVNGQYSHAEGQSNTVNSDAVSCHVEGTSNKVGGKTSHAEGAFNEALGNRSHVGGFESTANKPYAFAHGYNAHVGAAAGVALGEFINTYSRAEIALGRYNQSDESSAYILTVGIGENESSRKNALSINKSGNSFFDNEIHCKTLIVDDITVDKMNVGNIVSGSIQADSIIKIDYDGLVQLRNYGQLVPGTWYRIINYVTIVDSEEAGSLKQPFDILVFATSAYTLSEKAKAIHRENSYYFNDSNLDAWQIWYCLDNDENRFGWAKSDINNLFFEVELESGFTGNLYRSRESDINNNGLRYYCWSDETGENICFTDSLNLGHNMAFYQIDVEGEIIFQQHGSGYIRANSSFGVIYRMIDEFNNDCPYDFKNIYYKTDQEQTQLFTFYVYNNEGVTYEATKNILHTSKNIKNNKIKPYFLDNIQMLNHIHFGFSNNMSGGGYIECHCNIFDNNCFNISSKSNSDIIYNKFGRHCSDITIYDSIHNTFGDFCSVLEINESSFNHLGNYCENIKIIQSDHNEIGNCCNSIRINKSVFNTFKNHCRSITLGNENAYNTFGNNCYSIRLGEFNTYNIFGNNCSNIKFVSGYNVNNYLNYITNNLIEDGVNNIIIKNVQTLSINAQLQNVRLSHSLSNKEFTLNECGAEHEIIITSANTKEILV